MANGPPAVNMDRLAVRSICEVEVLLLVVCGHIVASGSNLVADGVADGMVEWGEGVGRAIPVCRRECRQ